MVKHAKKSALAMALTTALITTGCGGSSSSESTDATLNGVAIAGPVDGTVTVTDSSGATIATSAVTNGSFSLKLEKAHHDSELDLEVTGSYTDEVSGSTVNLSTSAPLALRLKANSLSASGTTTVAITPETTIIREMVVDGKSLTEATTQFEQTFGYAPTNLARPFDPTEAMPQGASEAEQRAAFMLGAYSQWGNDLGLSGDDLAGLPGALADDIADGTLDGMDSLGADVVIGSVNMHQLHMQSQLAARYLIAMSNFASSDKNIAGVSAPTTGLPTTGVTDAMGATRTITLSDNSTVTISLGANNTTPPFPMGPSVSRTVHRVSLSDASGVPIDVTAGGAVSGIQTSAMMHMLSGMSHATTYGSDYTGSSAATSGDYDFNVYYVMASSMMMEGSRVPMGVWDYKVTLTESDGTTTHTATFHPEVMMAMDGSILRAKGASPEDAPLMNGEPMPRPYFVWLHQVNANATGGHDLDLLVSTKKSMMMFPPVKSGLALGMSMDMTPVAPFVESVSLSLDLDGDGTYETALDGSSNNGHFTANGLTLLDVDGDGTLMDVSAELTLTHGDDNDPTTTADQTTFTMSPLPLAFKQPM